MLLDRLRTIPPLRAALILGLGTALLSAPFMPVWDAGLGRVVFRPRPELEAVLLVGAMALLALLGRSVPRPLRWIVAAFLALAALLHLGTVLFPAAFERELDLFWDLPVLPELLGLAVGGGGWLALAGVALSGVAFAVLIAAVLGEMERALRGARRPQAALALAGVCCALAAMPAAGGEAYLPARIAREISAQTDLAWRSLALLRGSDPLATPVPAASDLGKLRHRDLYLVLLDSYSVQRLEDARVAAALAALAKTANEAGYFVLSSRLAAPGGARLAEASLASGLRLDPLSYRMLLASGRRTFADYLAAAGYRTVEVAPESRRAGFDERSRGFERVIAAPDLGYAGEGGIPDEWTLEQVLERIDGKPHPPVFVRVELGSGRAAADAPAERVASSIGALADFLTHLKGQPLVILVGNRAAGAQTEVPIHVVSRDEDLVLPFATLGYAAGVAPPSGGAAKGVESFLPDFLRLFASGTSVASIL